MILVFVETLTLVCVFLFIADLLDIAFVTSQCTFDCCYDLCHAIQLIISAFAVATFVLIPHVK